MFHHSILKPFLFLSMFFIAGQAVMSQNIQYSWAIKHGSATADQAFAVDVDNAGNSYVCGAFTGTVDFDPGPGVFNLTSAGGDDIYLLKLDASGNFVWAKSIGGTVSDVALAITLDVNNNILITGHYMGTVDFDPGAGTFNLNGAGGIGDIFVAKYDNNGNFIWANGFGSATGANEQGSSIITDASGNVYVCGYMWGTIDFDPGPGTANLTSVGNADIFALKLNSAGGYVWANRFGSTTADDGRALTIDALGNVYVTGYFQLTVDFDPGAGTANLTSVGGNDIFLAKYDNNGNYSWANRFGSSGLDVSFSVQTDASNNVYMAGQFSNTIDFDPGAGTANLTSAGGTDIVVAKYTTTGNYIWAKNMGGTGNDIATLLCQDAAGNVFTTGSFTGTADFDPGAATVNLVSNGFEDVFLSKLDAAGNYLWAGKMGGPSADYSYSVSTGINSSVWIAGSFQGTADFDPSASTYNLTSNGSFDGFVEKFCVSSTASINVAACDSYVSPSGNYTWTTSGTYTDTIANIGGCDSIITVNLSVTSIASQSTTANPNPVCPGSTSTVSMASSQTGVNYSLVNNATSAVVSGPTAGTGAAMNFGTGALASTTTFDVVADPLSAVNLPTANDHIRYSTPFFSYTNKITIESWVYFDGVNMQWAGQSSAAFDNMATNVWLWHNGIFYVNDNGTWRALTFPAVTSAGWKHVATVANTTGLYIYYDGVLVASNGSGITSGIRNNAASIIDLGHDPRFAAGTPGRNNNLGFDNFMVWNTDRNLAQINSDKNNCLYGNETGLVLYTRMNEGSGTSLASVTGSSATIINPAANWIKGSGVCVNCSEIVSTIIVNVQDNTPPVTPSISDATGECSVTPTTPTTTDNCAGTVTGTTGTSFPITTQGTTVVTWTFSDGNGNSTTANQNIIIDDVTAPVISNCPSNISVNANQTGCTANVTWTAPTANDNCVGSVTPTSSHNPGANFPLGTTTVTYTFNDGNGNQSQCTFDVTVTNNLNGSSVDQMVSCNGGNDGSVDATITGGTSPYSVSWTGPNGFTAGTEDITGLEAGTYIPTVTDANGCTLIGSVVITEPAALSINLDNSTNPSSCGAADGTASITVTGGTAAGAYNYQWTDGGAYNSSAEDPNDLPAGAFTLTVTDDNGCTDNLLVTLSDPNGPTITLGSSAVTSLNCNGDTNGDAQVDVTLNGGATSATYLWDDASATTTEDLSNIGAGTYTIEVTDNNNCVATFSVTITEPTAISGNTVTTDVTCNGDNDGAIDLTVSGGTGALTFLWDDVSSSTTEDISGLNGGTYTVIITDANSCTDTISATINEPAALSSNESHTDESASGNDGTIDLTVTGGTGPYTFAWIGPNGFTSTSEDLTGLAGGTYDVTITDANGCTTTLQVTLLSSVGINEIAGNDLTIFPNPTNGIVTVKTNAASNTISIMDVAGRLVMIKETTGSIISFDLSASENGVYFVQVKNTNEVKTVRIILQK